LGSFGLGFNHLCAVEWLTSSSWRNSSTLKNGGGDRPDAGEKTATDLSARRVASRARRRAMTAAYFDLLGLADLVDRAGASKAPSPTVGNEASRQIRPTRRRLSGSRYPGLMGPRLEASSGLDRFFTR
jgi:hypothetical protein